MKEKKYIMERAIAGFIDYSIIIAITIFYIYTFSKPDHVGTYTVTGLLALTPFLLWLIYFILIEAILGATLGHIIIGLKPVHYNTEKPITLKQAAIRHLLDPVDYFFLFGLVGIFSIYSSPKSQRVGDLLARTKVLKS